jgi:transcriptional regulator with XRE-family HTH domain
VDELERRGRLLARLREERLWTREKLARRAGVNITTISHAEEGKTRLRLSTIEKIAGALEVDPLMLLHPEEEDIPPKEAAAPSSPEVAERREADPSILSGWERQALTDPAFVVEFERAKESESRAYALFRRYLQEGEEHRERLAELRNADAPEDQRLEERRLLSMAKARSTAASVLWGRLVDPGPEVAALSPVEAAAEAREDQQALFTNGIFESTDREDQTRGETG